MKIACTKMVRGETVTLRVRVEILFPHQKRGKPIFLVSIA
jgi:hypothetical protein